MRFAILILAVCALGACTAAAPPPPPVSTPMTDHQENEKLVRRLYEDYINHGRVDQFGDILAPDFVGAGPERGPAGFATVIRGLRTAFPDIVYTLEDVVSAGDRVAVRWSWRGTHTGPLRTFAPTGKSVVNTGFAIFQVKDGKFVHAWVETDRLGFLQAIGVIPNDPAFGPPRPTAPPATATP